MSISVKFGILHVKQKQQQQQQQQQQNVSKKIVTKLHAVPTCSVILIVLKSYNLRIVRYSSHIHCIYGVYVSLIHMI